MIYLLIFFLDEGRTSLYGSPVNLSIQGITYRRICWLRFLRERGSSQPSYPRRHLERTRDFTKGSPCAVERSLQSISWARTRQEFSSRSSCPFALEVITIQEGGYPSPGLFGILE